MKFRSILIIAIILNFFTVELSAQMRVLPVDDSLGMPFVHLQEITIRAPKQAMSLRELPGSASLVTAKAIEEAGIRSVKDITAYTPNFFMPDYGSKLTSPVYIRGIGSRINEPSVGLYVDNVPYFDKAAFDFELFDVERIEVLRGPQGTLYGRNTMGGIINVVSRNPFQFQGSRMRVSAGSYGNYQAGLSHFGKSGDDFGYSLSLNYSQQAGYFKNVYNNEMVDHGKNFSARNRLIYKLTPRWTIENVISYDYSRQGGYPYAIFNDTLQKVKDVNYDHPSSYDRDMLSNGLTFRYDGAQMDVLATTSFQYLKDFQDVDQDFTANKMFLATQQQKQNMLSQELIFKSKTGRKYEWLTGLYAFHQLFDRTVDITNIPANAITERIFDETKQGFALFHQSTLNDIFIRNLSFSLGLRMDAETDKLDFTNRVVRPTGTLVLADTLFPALNFTEISPRFSVKYKAGKTATFYALIAKGYKTGGFNAIFERQEDLMFDPEFSWNYEAGTKLSFLKNTLQMEAALFYIDWKNQQIYQMVPSGQGMMLKNAGKSVSKGFELSARASLAQNTNAMLSYGFTDAVFTEHKLNATVDYSGNFIPSVPRHTLGVQLNQGFILPQNLPADKLNFTVLYRMVGKHYWNEKNGQAQEAYGLLDLRAGIEASKWGIEFWAMNLLNTEYTSFYFEALGRKYAQAGKPFRFGTTLTVKL